MPEPLLTLCHNRPDRTVEAVVSLWQALWISAKREQRTIPEPGACILESGSVLKILHSELKKRLWLKEDEERCDQVASFLFGRLDQTSVRNYLCVPKEHFCLFTLTEAILRDIAPSCDLHYWAGRDLRHSSQMFLSAPVVRAVRNHTGLIKQWLESLDGKPIGHYGMFLVAADLPQNTSHSMPGQVCLTVENYFNLIAALGWVWPRSGGGEIEANPELFDAEKLIGRYFGLPTTIPGLDEIFAGSGVLLVDAPGVARGASVSADIAQPIGGRAIVVTGPYGSGKSTLALELGIEVARKGGAVIVAAMEQSPEECLYSLESLGICTDSRFFQIAREMREAIPIFSQPYSGTGVLAFLPILRPSAAEKTDQFNAFLQLLKERFDWLQGFPLRLIVIDPMNSVLSPAQERRSGQRRRLLDTFWDAKRRGINLCLTRERIGDLDRDTPFEENIADTVLQIVTNKRGSTLRRSIEIRKSRLQREETGRHDLAIVQNKGLQIFPSSASVARIAAAESRKREAAAAPIHLGIDGIDRLLGEGGLLAGNIVALDGPPGSSRTLIGAHFLFVHEHQAAAQANTPKSLFISDSDRATMLSQLQLAARQRKDRDWYGKKSLEDIAICPLLADAVEPSQILQIIKDQFEQARKEQRTIDRVLLADVSRWDKEHDLPHQDETFGHALMSLLRSYGATCVLLADYINADQTSIIRDVIVNSADCILKFERMDFRGQLRQFVRATKTREMTHRRDLVEMVVARGAVDVRSTGVLLRKDENGNVHPVKIRLFLHADSPHHHEFNKRLMGSLQTSLTDAVLEDQWSHYDPQIFRLSASSAVDEVQVMQLDEYQLPNAADPEIHDKFNVFCPEENNGLPFHNMGQWVDRLGKRIVTPDGGYIGVPFYQNISVLARQQERLKIALERVGSSTTEFERLRGKDVWLQLQKLARDWESQGEEYWFFSCPLAQPETVETYSCLFFEILLSFVKPGEKNCRLADWLELLEARTAAMILRDLCHRSHRHEQEYFEKYAERENERKLRVFTNKFDSSDPGPVFWRHWYNTLSEMMWDLPSSERSKISVTPLPGDVTLAGEWYLTVPAYSAAPEVAWQVIQMITSPDRELQRIYHGVGLPTRESYYRYSAPANLDSLVSPFFHISRTALRNLVDSAFQRSTFPCYYKMTETISAHLQRILELPPLSDYDALTNQVNAVMRHLSESIDYIRESAACPSCHNHLRDSDEKLDTAEIRITRDTSFIRRP